jgi:hypothetical protein
MSKWPHVAALSSVMFFAGCLDSPKKPAKTESTGEGIFHKTTQEVGKFDSNAANQVVGDHKIHASDPVLGPLAAYGPILESAAILRIKQGVESFNILEGHYPTYEEFMEKIIKGTDPIQLPVLPYRGKYMYDVEKHELVIVRSIEDSAKEKGEE